MKMSRKDQKAASLQRILDVTARRLREEGTDGAAIASVMKEAGLTHGAFYSHFDNKDELAQAGFSHAIDTNHPLWFKRGRKAGETFWQRLQRLARGYLNGKHRDSIGASCAISALATDIPRASDGLQSAYENAYLSTINQITDGNPDEEEAAIAFFSLCVGSLLLSRNIRDEALSQRILDAGRKQVERLT